MLPQGLQASEFSASLSAGTATVLPIGGRGIRWRVAIADGQAAATVTVYTQLLKANGLGVEGERSGTIVPAGIAVVLDVDGNGTFNLATSDETLYTVVADATFSATIVCSPMSPDETLVTAGSIAASALQYSSDTPDADGNLTLTDGVTSTKVPYTP